MRYSLLTFHWLSSPRRIRDKDELLEAGISPSLDLAFLDDMDPNIGTNITPSLKHKVHTLVDGFRLFFEREVPLELRTYDGSNFPTEVPPFLICCTLNRTLWDGVQGGQC